MALKNELEVEQSAYHHPLLLVNNIAISTTISTYTELQVTEEGKATSY